MTRRLSDQLLIMDSILVAKGNLDQAMSGTNTLEQDKARLQLSNLYALLDIPRLSDELSSTKRVALRRNRETA